MQGSEARVQALLSLMETTAGELEERAKEALKEVSARVTLLCHTSVHSVPRAPYEVCQRSPQGRRACSSNNCLMQVMMQRLILGIKDMHMQLSGLAQ